MQRPSISLLMPLATPKSGKACSRTKARGMAVLMSPQLNKGTAFTLEERKALALVGLLPPAITSLDHQTKRAYQQYQRLPDAMSKNIYLTALHDRNDVLFFRLFSQHLREMIPIVNDLTVGAAMEQYRHESRRPGGVYLSIDHPEAIGEAFKNFCADADDIDLILATDAELILGIGDWGVGGIEVAIGKLAVYTAAGGIDPARVIPVMLDVGTNRDSLLNDPMYIGNRHPRVRGKSYDDFIDAYVTAASKLFPHALLHWAGLGWNNGRRILDKYSDRMCMFDDEIQGAGAITLAAAISAARVCGAPLRNQRVVIFGDGCLNTAIADPICGVMMHEGLSRQDATRRFWFVDKQGLLIANAVDRSRQSGTPYARPAADVKGWKRDSAGGEIDLSTVVRQVQPTMLIGASASSGAFTEAIVKAMAAHTDRPIIFPLSTSASLAEATPSDLLAWTDGRALIATGSSFSPVTHKGITYVIGQVSNTMLYPGLGLGTIVSRARRISDGMIRAAANAVSSLVAVSQAGASLLPQVDDLRSVSAIVAVAVAEAAAADGLAGIELTDIVQQVQDAMWLPEYGQIDAA